MTKLIRLISEKIKKIRTFAKDKGEQTVKKPTNKWNDADRQAFRDGNRLRAATIPNKKKALNKLACRIPSHKEHNFD